MSEEEAKKLEDAHFVSSGDKSDHPSQQWPDPASKIAQPNSHVS
jgi:hypothetical protein